MAELLKDRGSPADLKEVCQLLNALWEKGYRTYGKQPIDLSGMEQPSEHIDHPNETVCAAAVNSAITQETIISNVCEYYRVDEASLKGIKRTREVSEARRVAMCLMKQLLDMNYSEIGKIFGRVGSASLHNVEEIKKRLQKQDDALEAILRDLIARLEDTEGSAECLFSGL